LYYYQPLMHTKFNKAFFALAVFSLCFFFVPFVHGLESFGIIGDTRIGRNDSVYEGFIEHVNREKIGTIIITGDVINSAGKQKLWERFLEITGPGKEIHIALGNHDVKDKKSLELYERIMGKPSYYSFVDNDCLFVFLNTEVPGQEARITGEQFEWVKRELSREFRYKFVFLHRPVFPSPFGTSYGLDKYKVERDALHELFVKNRVSLVFAGHEHLYHKSEKDGIAYVITGGGGAPLLTFWPEHGGFFHYIIAKRTNEGYVFTVRDTSGNTKDQFSIKK
jgi:3',5'-cyclic AMP phosphodiesterase CpdA